MSSDISLKWHKVFELIEEHLNRIDEVELCGDCAISLFRAKTMLGDTLAIMHSDIKYITKESVDAPTR